MENPYQNIPAAPSAPPGGPSLPGTQAPGAGHAPPQAAAPPQSGALPPGSAPLPGYGAPSFTYQSYEAVHQAARGPKKGKTGRGRMGLVFAALFLAGAVMGVLLFGVGRQLVQKPQETGPMVLQPAQGAPEGNTAESEPNGEYYTSDIVDMVAPSVVSIDLYEYGSLSPSGSGSGIVYNADGYIITNAHVVEDAFAIRVILAGGEGYTATLVGQDAASDLAVLKINAGGLVPATFADSSGLRRGQRVIAIGNAGGILPGSVTQGVVSGVNREIAIQSTDGAARRMVLIQTDAAINPGNSGGALVDGWGRVVGINVAKLEEEHIDNIGFAIPVHLALPVVAALIEDGYIPERSLLGVSVLALNETTGPPQGLPAKGLYIAEIQERSDLARHGIQVGDVIIAAGGRPMQQAQDLINAINGMLPGDEVELEIWQQQTGETITVTAVLYVA